MRSRRQRVGVAAVALAAVSVVAVIAVVGGMAAGFGRSGSPATGVGGRGAGGGRGTGESGVVALPAPHFVEETSTSGLSFTYGGPFEFATGGGVAVFDCDADGRPDIYLAGGAHPAQLFRNASPTGGSLRFTPAGDAATDATGVMGAYPLDVDGDGIVDLAVLRIGEPLLLRGLGNCRFEDATARWGLAVGPGMWTAMSATWEPGSGWPTLALGRYLALDAAGATTFDCATNAFVRPAAGGSTFAAPSDLAPGFCTLSMLFSDWSASGRRDLRVSNDSHYYDAAQGSEQLWRVAPGAPPRLYTDADGWVRVQIEGMGIGSWDVTGDGLPDVYLTSQADNRLQTLTAGPSTPAFRDIGAKRGVNAAQPFTGGDTLPSTAWHPEFADVNNDGLIDLFVSKGNVDKDPLYATHDPSDLFLGQPDGTFREAADAAGIVSFARGRGAALADFNSDGLLDLVEANFNDPVRLWRNAGAGTAAAPAPMGTWAAVAVTESGANRNAIGGWVDVRVGDAVERRELTVGGGHAGGQLGWLHVGLGSAREAQVRVQWPDGEVGPWQGVTAGTFVTMQRGAAAPQLWTPAP